MDLRPLPNETQPQHFDRCFPLVDGDTDAKSRACLAAWRQAHPDVKAQQKFAKGEFELSPDHVVFAEHSIPGHGGKVEQYDRAALEGIVAKLNARIRDRGAFPPVCDGHTPTPEDMAKGAIPPRILGYQSNFRLAKIGNENPTYAIACDEYHRKDCADELRSKPRRSVEIWLDQNIANRYWDPCAALGSITPRLDLPLPDKLQKQSGEVLRYSRDPRDAESGLAQARYDAVGAMSAGPLNSYVPGVNAPRQPEKERYDAMTPEEMKQLADMLTQSLVAALKAEPAAPAADPAAPPADPAKMGDAGDDPNKPADPNADPMKQQPYAKALAERDQKIATLERLSKDHEAQLAKMAAAARHETRVAAYAKARAAGYEFDEAEEIEATKDFSDAQFDAHMVRLRKNYQKANLNTAPLWTPGPSPLPAPAAAKENDELSLEVARYAKREGVSYGAAKEKIQKDRAAAKK